MDLDRVKHSYVVAKKMQEIGKNMNLTKEQLHSLFILGLNHDIGYQITDKNEHHNKIGGEKLKQENYKYWKEVYYHGEINPKYTSLYLDILNLADMQINKYGEEVGFEKRLLDIMKRYGNESIVYKKSCILIENLKNKYQI